MCRNTSGYHGNDLFWNQMCCQGTTIDCHQAAHSITYQVWQFIYYHNVFLVLLISVTKQRVKFHKLVENYL